MGGLGNGGWRGALRIAQRQAPLRGEGSGELGWGLPGEAGVGSFGVIQLNVRTPTLTTGARFFIAGTLGLAERFMSMR
jgi:hypothetical protein